MIMTRFDVIRLKPYQKEVINATLCSRDYLVIEPTGSGKSMCVQLTAVYKLKINNIHNSIYGVPEIFVVRLKNLDVLVEIV